MKLEFSRQMFGKSWNTKYHQNPSSGSRLVPWGRTDGHSLAPVHLTPTHTDSRTRMPSPTRGRAHARTHTHVMLMLFHYYSGFVNAPVLYVVYLVKCYWGLGCRYVKRFSQRYLSLVGCDSVSTGTYILTCCRILSLCLLRLMLDPEEGGTTFYRNVGSFVLPVRRKQTCRFPCSSLTQPPLTCISWAGRILYVLILVTKLLV
jgi:hypothetical protein